MILLITTNGVDHLSDKEIEVMKLASIGLCEKEIAARLGVSVAAVKKRIEFILSKLQIEGRWARVKLAHLALHLHLVPNLYLHLNEKRKR